MTAGRISSNNNLLWVNTQLLKRLGNNPAVNLKAIAEWNGERILRSQSVINRKDNYIIVSHHVCPLPSVIGMLKTTHAHKCSSMEM
jgi:hypothetical protein